MGTTVQKYTQQFKRGTILADCLDRRMQWASPEFPFIVSVGVSALLQGFFHKRDITALYCIERSLDMSATGHCMGFPARIALRPAPCTTRQHLF